MTYLSRAIQRWTTSIEDPAGDAIWQFYTLLQYLSEHLYHEYEPTLEPGHADFGGRLDRWLAAVDDDDDRRLLFTLLSHLYFIGRQEFEALYTSTFNDVVLHWLADVTDVRMDQDLGPALERALSQTWFCPITDSMEIARFCHLNRITTSPGHRPDWRSLVQFGDIERIVAYCRHHSVAYVVLLEDFVGTGNQASAAAKLARQVAAEVPLRGLICPLLITRDGLDAIANTLGSSSSVEIRPRQILNEHLHVRAAAPIDRAEPDDRPALRGLLNRIHTLVDTEGSASPFGWGDVGTLGVMYTNCPNNVPPVFHREAPGWWPLFPRSTRSS